MHVETNIVHREIMRRIGLRITRKLGFDYLIVKLDTLFALQLVQKRRILSPQGVA